MAVDGLGWPLMASDGVPHQVHTTFQYGGAPGKRHRLREAMLWLDPPSHYTPAAGVLTYTPDVPDALVAPLGGMSAAGHVELMRHQLYQLRAALLLAFALGRVLVLPSLVCGFDKYWAPITAEGVIPGAWHWALPIRRCPLDHLLNPAELREPTRYVREYVLYRPLMALDDLQWPPMASDGL